MLAILDTSPDGSPGTLLTFIYYYFFVDSLYRASTHVCMCVCGLLTQDTLQCLGHLDLYSRNMTTEEG